VHFLKQAHEFVKTIPGTRSEKKYESCHWGCTYSKGKLLSILGANMYILGLICMLGANMYILGVNMYILGDVHFRC